MVIIPKKKVTLENLNSYYVDIYKLIQHFQGEVGSGSIYFKCMSLEGVIFFDQDNILDGFYLDEKGVEATPAHIDQLINEVSANNCTLSIYRVDPEKIYFWSHIYEAKRIYSNLSSEFTELGKLIKKMIMEKLTGYIEVTVGDGEEGGLLFFINGDNFGGLYSLGNDELDSTKESLTKLIDKTKEIGGVFHVNKIEFPKAVGMIRKKQMTSEKEKKEHAGNTCTEEFAPDMSEVLHMLELLLNIMERIVQSKKSIKDNFSTLLKKKFVENANKYDFLDPFEAEFEYKNQKITFFGNTPQSELAKGVMESVEELSKELEIEKQLKKEGCSWSDKYSEELRKLRISF